MVPNVKSVLGCCPGSTQYAFETVVIVLPFCLNNQWETRLKFSLVTKSIQKTLGFFLMMRHQLFRIIGLNAAT